MVKQQVLISFSGEYKYKFKPVFKLNFSKMPREFLFFSVGTLLFIILINSRIAVCLNYLKLTLDNI